jgi:hypothetical protein
VQGDEMNAVREEIKATYDAKVQALRRVNVSLRKKLHIALHLHIFNLIAYSVGGSGFRRDSGDQGSRCCKARRPSVLSAIPRPSSGRWDLLLAWVRCHFSAHELLQQPLDLPPPPKH